MSRKLALSLLLVVLGLATFDAFLDHEEWSSLAADDSAAVFAAQDGTGFPPRP